MVPRFSIVVPSFNRPELVAACLTSVVIQDFEDWELILVDDASDQPLGRSSEVPVDGRIRLLRNQARLGAGASRNIGAAEARGTFIHFLDSDDRLAAGALTRLNSLAQCGHSMLVGAWEDVAPEGTRALRQPARPYRDALANCVVGGWVTGAVSIRADIYPRISETRMPWEMAEAFLAACASAGSAGHTPCVVAEIAQQSPLSLTVAHDHFEPLQAGRFWAEMKKRYADSTDRHSAFDKRLLDAALMLRHRGAHEAAATLLAEIDPHALADYPWHRPLEPAWFASKLGFGLGLGVHDTLSRLKRACWPHA